VYKRQLEVLFVNPVEFVNAVAVCRKSVPPPSGSKVYAVSVNLEVLVFLLVFVANEVVNDVELVNAVFLLVFVAKLVELVNAVPLDVFVFLAVFVANVVEYAVDCEVLST